MNLDEHGLAARKRLIAYLISEVGREKVTAWMEDSDKLSLINALCDWVGRCDSIIDRVYDRVLSELSDLGDCPTCDGLGEVESFNSPTGYAGCPDCQLPNESQQYP